MYLIWHHLKIKHNSHFLRGGKQENKGKRKERASAESTIRRERFQDNIVSLFPEPLPLNVHSPAFLRHLPAFSSSPVHSAFSGTNPSPPKNKDASFHILDSQIQAVLSRNSKKEKTVIFSS